MVQLVKYSAACRALSIAKSVDEVKDIRDKSIAIQEYAKQAKNRQMEIDAAEIRIRAERRLGELLKETEKATGTRGQRLSAGPGRGNKTGGAVLEPPVSVTPTLAEQGIDKKLSSRAQKLAAIPDKVFEKKLSGWKEQVEAGNQKIHTDILQKTTHVSNNTGENEWYTPKEYIDAAVAVMGAIDCDPASTDIANKVVKAKAFYSESEDGLKQKWGKRVWMNPPYAQPAIANFAEAVSSKYESGEVEQACILVNNATETKWFQRMLSVASAVCFVAGRVRFLDPQGNPGAPLQGQAVLYLGARGIAFKNAFSRLGEVLWKSPGE